MNDFEDIWKPALVKAGVWERGQKTQCDRIGGCMREMFDGSCKCDDYLDIPAPVLGDAEAVVKFVKYLAPRYAIIKYDEGYWQVNSGEWSESLGLALAAAVLASP